LDACQQKLNIQSKNNPNAQLLAAFKKQAQQSQNFSAILSCDRNEYSWEISELGHGLFTYYLIEGLRGKAAKDNGEIEVKKLFEYVRDRIKKYIDYWNSPERFQIRQENLSKGIVVKPSRSQTPQQIFRGSEDIVLGKAVTAANRKALVIKTLAVSETAVNLCQILQGKGGFEVDYCFPEDKEETELEKSISLCLQSPSKTVLLYLAGKIAETDKSVYQLWLSDSAYITLNWLKQQLDESPIAEKIIVIDCFGTNNLDRCFNLLKPSTERSQSIIAALVKQSNQTEFITQLVTVLKTAADSQAEFWVAELITQLQKNCRSNSEITLKSWLSGATEVLELLLPQTERSLVPFDANYCPYKGLLAFSKEDANFFYGRDTLIQEIVSQLKNTSFLAVVGASGSGKSSVVKAGVLPQLETKGLYSDRIGQLQLCQTWVMRPGSNPIAALVNSIASNNREFIEGLIHSGIDAFNFWLQQQSQPMSVLVIDQFEELFTLTAQSDRFLFIQFILAVCDRARDCFKVIVTLRDDFMKECLNLPELGEIVQQSHILVVSYFTEEQYRQIITQPARQVGIKVEEELVKVLLEEVQTGSLPLLQFALAELWRVRTPGSLTLQDYQQHIGGIAQILEEKADLTYNNLTEAQQECAQLIFLSLVQLGEGKEDTRRRLTRSQLLVSKYDKDKASRELFQSTLQALIDARLIVVSLEENNPSPNNTEETPPASCLLPSASSTSEVTVEVIHEILIRNWQTLRWWLDKNRDRLRLMREIEQQARQWQENQQNKDYLLRRTALARAEELYIKYADKLSHSSNQFIGECIKERDRLIAQKELEAKIAKRNRRLVRSGLIGGLIAVSGFAGAAIWQLRQANINEINALSNSAEAQLKSSRELDAVITGLKAGRKIQNNKLGVDTKTKIKVIGGLQDIFYQIKNFNVLAGNTTSVEIVKFSPDGQIIATAEKDYDDSQEKDYTVKLWDCNGKLLHNLTGHKEGILDVEFSPDGQIIATGGFDNTVKLWNRNGKLLYTLSDHSDDVLDIVFSPNGQTIATASEDFTVKLWNLQGQLLHTLKDHTSFANSTVFSPDGKMILSAGGDGKVNLWSLDGTLIRTLSSNDSPIKSAVFSPDGKTIAVGSNDKTVKLWNLQGELLHTLTGHTDQVKNVVFSPDGKIIASTGKDQTIRLWNLQGELLRTLEGVSGYFENRIIFSPNGKILASAGENNTVKVWNLEGELLYILEGHINQVNRVAFSPDSHTLASASYDQTVRLWNLEERFPANLKGHTQQVNEVEFSPDGQTVASGSDDGTVNLWSISGELLQTLQDKSGDRDRGMLELEDEHGKLVYSFGSKSSINQIVFSPDGQIIASANYAGVIRIWNQKGQLLHTLTGHTSQVKSLVFSPDSQILASGSEDGTVKLWNQKGQLIHTLTGHKDFVNQVAFSPDSQIIASAAGGDDTVRLWNREGKLLHILKGHTDYVSRVAFSPDGKIIASTGGDDKVRLWNLDGKLLKILEGRIYIYNHLLFSPDGKILAFASDEEQKIKLWNRNGKLLHNLEGHTETITNIIFTPDSQFIVSSSWDNTVKIWNLKGELLQTLKSHTDWVNDVAISPDAKTIASAGKDGTVKLWSLDLDEVLKTGCDWARDYLINNPNVSEEDRKLCEGI
jgi:WD40 repeat protein/energy-coupling factor transporter ATP-binding protein EcfA2